MVPGRTVLAASVAALLLLAIAAALFGWIWWTTPKVDRDAQEDERQRQIVSLVHTGYQFLRFGDPATATLAFRQAEDLAPEKQKPHLRRLRLTAQQRADEFGELVGRSKQVVERLMAAQQAMDNRRYVEAQAAADEALALDPGSTKAQEIRTSALAAQARLQEQERRQRAQRTGRQQEEIAANTTAPEPEPVATTAVEEPVSQIASLHISFQSDMPGISTVRVHVNGRNVFQGTAGSKGRFRGGKGGRTGGTVPVAAGDANIQVWVTPPGEGAKLITRDGNFLGGSDRSLNIRLPQGGPPSADLTGPS